MSTVLHLYRLQQVDSLIDKAQKRLNEIQVILNDNKEMRHAKAILTNAEKIFTKTTKTLAQKEAEVKEQRVKIEQTESMLYSGNIKNPKEVQDMQNQSVSLKKHLGTLEDRQLEAMIANDDAEETFNKSLSTLNILKARLAAEHQDLDIEQTSLNEEKERLQSERNAVLPVIEKSSISLYDKLRQSKHGIAITLLIDGCCSVCGATLTPAQQQDTRSANMIVYCPSCRRIIYGS